MVGDNRANISHSLLEIIIKKRIITNYLLFTYVTATLDYGIYIYIYKTVKETCMMAVRQIKAS